MKVAIPDSGDTLQQLALFSKVKLLIGPKYGKLLRCLSSLPAGPWIKIEGTLNQSALSKKA
jgi:hypothetical protein